MENLLLKTTQAWQIWVIFGEQRDPRSRGLARWHGPHRDTPGMCKCRAPTACGWAMALRCPGGDADRCHIPDKKLSIPLMDKPCFSSLYQDGTVHSELEHKWWEGKCQEEPVSSRCRSCATGALWQQLLAGSRCGWLSRLCATRQERRMHRGERRQLQEMHREIKTAKGKGAAAGKHSLPSPCQTARFPLERATQMDPLLSTYLFLSRNKR